MLSPCAICCCHSPVSLLCVCDSAECPRALLTRALSPVCPAEQAVYNRPQPADRSRCREGKDTVEAYQLAQRLQSMVQPGGSRNKGKTLPACIPQGISALTQAAVSLGCPVIQSGYRCLTPTHTSRYFAVSQVFPCSLNPLLPTSP